MTTKTDEVAKISQLLALCFLLGGVYSYSRNVRKKLPEKFTILERDAKESLDKEVTAARARSPIQERTIQENTKPEPAPECKHQFGYLRTLPRDASIPNECLSCIRIVDCKHSLANTLENRTRSLKHDQSSDQATVSKTEEEPYILETEVS